MSKNQKNFIHIDVNDERLRPSFVKEEDFRSCETIGDKDPIVWMLNNNKSILFYDSLYDPLSYAVSNHLKIEGEDPILWAARNKKGVVGGEPAMLWAIRCDQEIENMTAKGYIISKSPEPLKSKLMELATSAPRINNKRISKIAFVLLITEDDADKTGVKSCIEKLLPSGTAQQREKLADQLINPPKEVITGPINKLISYISECIHDFVHYNKNMRKAKAEVKQLISKINNNQPRGKYRNPKNLSPSCRG